MGFKRVLTMLLMIFRIEGSDERIGPYRKNVSNVTGGCFPLWALIQGMNSLRAR